MTAQAPCSACSWTPERQAGCRYNSHVKLFYGVSDRGLWSLGFNLILKERSDEPSNFEAANARFLKEKTSIPLPTIVEDWREDDGCYFVLMKRVRGEPLSSLWATMPTRDKERVAKQTAEYLIQLRQLHSPRMQSLGGQPLYSVFLFPTGYGLPHGPFSSDDELWSEMAMALKGVPEDACLRLRRCMPPAAPYTLHTVTSLI